MAACEAALTTTELLENIILQLPREDIEIAAKVCKTWRNAVHESSAIRKARCITPLSASDFERLADYDAVAKAIGDEKYIIRDRDLAEAPHYTGAIDFNPPVKIGEPKGLRNLALRWNLGSAPDEVSIEAPDAEYGGAREEFISKPRITTIVLSIESAKTKEYISSCSIRRAMGVTIGDVLDAKIDMIAAESKYCPERTQEGSNWSCFGSLARKVDAGGVFLLPRPKRQ